MIIPFDWLNRWLFECECAGCGFRWYCVDMYQDFPSATSNVIECDKCLRAVFYDYIGDESYRGVLNVPENKRTGPSFLDSLPACFCGGRFRQRSKYHALYSEPHRYPTCPVCEKSNINAQRLIGPQDFNLWVYYMDRTIRVGPNDVTEEIIPYAFEQVSLYDIIHSEKPRLLIGQGLKNGKADIHF